MAFRYLIYRTDYGNTIIRESAVDDSGANEAALFTEFVIPANQPLFLWRESAGDVIPNTEQNINDWSNFINPPTGDESVNYYTFTGYTGTTATQISGIEDDITYMSGATDGKLDKVSGAVNGNVPIFSGAGGVLVDSGYDINDLLGGSTGGTPMMLFTGYTASTEVRLQGIEENITYLSGATDQNSDDIQYISGQTANKLDTSVYSAFTGATDTRISGIEDDVTYLSGQTDLKLNISDFNIYSGATKSYIDSVAVGLDPKASVRVATTADLGATYNSTGGAGGTGQFTSAPTVIDGITLANGNRVLVKNQIDPTENGIYVVVSSGTWDRSSDMDGSSAGEVSAGNYTFVETGNTLSATGWLVYGDGILTLNSDDIIWVQFNAATTYVAGVGIVVTGNTIQLDGASIAGNNLSWSGTQLNLVITGGTLGPALDAKLDKVDFNSYTATTQVALVALVNDINYISGQTDQKLNISDFNTYSGDTDTRISGIEDDIVYVSGITDQKLDTSTFNTYTGDTDTRISGIEDDIVYISGVTDQKLDASIFNTYSGDTDAHIAYISGVTDTKLPTATFAAYTGSTQANELHLIKTGVTDINTVTPTGISWDGAITTGSSYSWTGGSRIVILEAGEYEITYNIPVNHIGSNNDRGYGANIILNNSTIINRTFSGAMTNRAGMTTSLGLPSINVTFAANDRIDLIAFRTGLSGTSNTAPNPSILIKKKARLQ